MKISLIVIALATIFFSQNSIAQNVGIGTTTPGNLLELKNNGATTPGLRINNTTATWQLGVGVNSANDALFGIYNSSAGNALVINSSGNVGIGTTNPAALVEVNGYTKLGSDAPSIKIKKFTGTTSPNNGGFTAFAHGLNHNKIISITVMVESYGSDWVEPTIAGRGIYYHWTETSGNVFIINYASDCVNILGRNYTVVIMYAE